VSEVKGTEMPISVGPVPDSEARVWQWDGNERVSGKLISNVTESPSASLIPAAVGYSTLPKKKVFPLGILLIGLKFAPEIRTSWPSIEFPGVAC